MKKFAMFVAGAIALVSVPGAVYAQADYIGNAKCKICHNKADEGDIWNKFKASDHAKALETLKSDKAAAAAKKAGLQKPPAESPECLKCHVTAYDVAKAAAPAAIVPDDGVQCESCHGPASLHMEDGKKFKAKKDASIDMKAHHVQPKPEACLECHNDKSPTWDPERYTTADGKKVGFDYDQAWKKIEHSLPKKAAK